MFSSEDEQNKGQARTEEKETGRLEAFSDGVFAIAITLLILQIPLPHENQATPLLTQLGRQWALYLAYLVSFMTILIMWVNHHALFRLIHRTDQLFLVLNGLLLMVITFVNYPLAVLAESLQAPYSRKLDTDQHTAALFYNGVFIVIAIIYNVLWRYASHKRRLLSRGADPLIVETITRQYRFGPLFYVASFLLAFVSVWASLGLNLLLAVYFAFTGRTKSPTAAPGTK
ncbi:MAG TPA: TMEM175 family protein [Ktedonobacterales bacterium]|nr:TMEM175 family protein [Ktedonobacterales bacterium]